MVDPEAQEILSPVLTEGETLLWAARVDPKAQARAATPRFLYALALISCSTIALGITASVVVPALSFDPGYAVGAVLPILLAIVGIAGALQQFNILHRGRAAAYGLTPRRVLVATAGPAQARVSVPISRIAALHTDGDASLGTIMLTAAPEGAPKSNRASSIGFSLLSIRHPHKVEALLLDLIAPRKDMP